MLFVFLLVSLHDATFNALYQAMLKPIQLGLDRV
jgi:hypothetical protein